MNIELEDVVGQTYSDESLEAAAGGTQAANGFTKANSGFCGWC